MEDTHYNSVRFPGMRFLRRNACDSIMLDTPQVPISEITTDPYAAEGKRLAIEDRQRRHHEFVHGEPTRYFNWRQSIGNDYYDEQDRLAGRVTASGRVAANDNHPANHRRAA